MKESFDSIKAFAVASRPENQVSSGLDIETLAVKDAESLRQAAECLEAVRKRAPLIGVGTRADIHNDILRYNERREIIGMLCVKENVRASATSHLQHGLLDEGRYQALAQRVLEQAGMAVRVPGVLSHIETDDQGEYLVMEAVHGKTLWRRIMEAALESDPQLKAGVVEYRAAVADREGDAQSDWERLIDVDLENALIAIRGEAGLVSYLVERAKHSPFLSSDQVNELRSSVEAWHKAGFFHRDLHSKNVMIDEEGALHVIDFGTALYQPGATENEARNMGEEYVSDSDFNVVNIMQGLVRLTVEEQREAEERRERKLTQRGQQQLDRWGLRAQTETEFNALVQAESPLFWKVDSLTSSKNYSSIVELGKALLAIAGEFGEGRQTQIGPFFAMYNQYRFGSEAEKSHRDE